MSDLAIDYTRLNAPALLNVPRSQSVLSEAGVDCIIATSPENVAYLTGYYCQTHWTHKGTLVFAFISASGEPRPAVVAPALELDAWAEQPPASGEFRACGTSGRQIGRIVGGNIENLAPDDQYIYEHGLKVNTHPGAIEVLVEALTAAGLHHARIAIDESGITYRARQQIIEHLPEANIVDGASLLRRIRMIKSKPEIERLACAARLTYEALGEAMKVARQGVSEKELLNTYNARIARGGGRPTFAIINAGRRTGHVHSIPSDYTLKPGDLVKYDVGCSLDLYHSDVGRTQVIGGNPTDRQLRIYSALLAGEQAGIAMLKPGIRPSEVFTVAVEAVRNAGLPDYHRHHVGHGIGIEVYDPPLLQPAASSTEFSGLGGLDNPLEEDMVLNVETPYYALGECGMIIEDTVVITRDGARYLADFPRELA